MMFYSHTGSQESNNPFIHVCQTHISYCIFLKDRVQYAPRNKQHVLDGEILCGKM